MSDQQVTKGRIVEFFPGDSHRTLPSGQSYPAIVTGVYEGGILLVVFSDFGTLPTGTLVPHKQGAVEGRDYWDWFPMVPQPLPDHIKAPDPAWASPLDNKPKDLRTALFGVIKLAMYNEKAIVFLPGRGDGKTFVSVAVGGEMTSFGPAEIVTIDGSAPSEVLEFSDFSEEKLLKTLLGFISKKKEGGGK